MAKKNNAHEDDDFLANEEALEGEMEIYGDQLEAHPEYADFLDSPDGMTCNYFDESGQEVSPLLHIQLHVALEKQIRAGDPAAVSVTMDRLIARGDDPHDAQHAIMRVLAEEMWSVMKDERAFDAKRYCKELKKL